jgi:hypothetical protein
MGKQAAKDAALPKETTMKTLNMFLVVSMLTVTGCSGSPDANGEDGAPAAGATPQLSPAEEHDSIPRDRASASAVVPFEGSAGSRSGQPNVPDGTTGGGTPSTHRHEIE